METPDIIFGLGSIFFCIALLPSITSEDKPSLWTSIPTAAILWIFSLTYLELDFIFASVISLITGTLWWILAVQQFMKKRTL